MKTAKPTSRDISELASFLPRLYADGYVPIKQWHGGIENPDGVFSWPWPEYDNVTSQFYKAASSDRWTDPEYLEHGAHQLLDDVDAIETADLNQVKTMLTFCVRGERFCEGHWGAMIEGGYVRRLLNRLIALDENNDWSNIAKDDA